MTDSDNELYDSKKINERLRNMKSLADLTGEGGIIQEMIKSTVERILKAEQESHLGYEPYQKPQEKLKQNSRNGYSKKTIKTSNGEMEIAIPRDREGTFEPQFIPKHQTFDPDLEKRVLGLYSKGMTVRDIGDHLKSFYGTEVSPALISKVTDSILEEMREWQQRPLNSCYPVVYFDCIFFKTRHDNKVINKASYTALAITMEGKIEVLGLWLAETEGAHFWSNVFTDLKARGVKDIVISCVDGVTGFSDAIKAIYPRTDVQRCIVHQIRNSLRYVGSTYQKEFLKDLKLVYQAPTLEIAEENLSKLVEKWEKRYPAVTKSWQSNWGDLSTYFLYPLEIRRMIYTTNAVEALHRQIRKVTKAKSVFPTDQSVQKMIYLAVRDIEAKSKCKQHWAEMIGQLRMLYGERVKIDLHL